MASLFKKSNSFKSKNSKNSNNLESDNNSKAPYTPPPPSAPPAPTSSSSSVFGEDNVYPRRKYSKSLTNQVRAGYFDKPLPMPPTENKTYTTHIPYEDEEEYDEEYDEDDYEEEDDEEYDDDDDDENSDDLLEEIDNYEDSTANELMYGDLELSEQKADSHDSHSSFVFVDTSRRSKDNSHRRNSSKDLEINHVSSPFNKEEVNDNKEINWENDNNSKNRFKGDKSFLRHSSTIKRGSVERELKKWIHDSVYDTSLQQFDKEKDLLDYIKDGVVLCKLANSIVPNLIEEHEIQRPVYTDSSPQTPSSSVPVGTHNRNNTKNKHKSVHSRTDSFRDIEVKQSNKIRAQMNIQHFREACQTIGLSAEYIFSFEELYVQPNKKRVLQSLMELKQHASVIKAQNFRENLDRGSVMDSPGWTVFEAFALPFILFYVLVISGLLRVVKRAVSDSDSSTEKKKQ